MPVDELFDVVVDSSEVGMRKPNPAIYHHALELLGGVPPERGRVPRRRPGNVDGARRAGLHAILVEDPRRPSPSSTTCSRLTTLPHGVSTACGLACTERRAQVWCLSQVATMAA